MEDPRRRAPRPRARTLPPLQQRHPRLRLLLHQLLRQSFPPRQEVRTMKTSNGDKAFWTSDDLAAENFNPDHDLSYPGQYPFTRGIQPTMYRGRLWTMRQY